MQIQMHIICICIYISYSISFYSLDSPYKSPAKYLIFMMNQIWLLPDVYIVKLLKVTEKQLQKNRIYTSSLYINLVPFLLNK